MAPQSLQEFLKSCGREGLGASIDELGLSSVEDVSMCEPQDLESDLGLSKDAAAEIVAKAKEQFLFDKRKDAVQRTWKAAEEALGVEATKLFYKKLFEENPSVIPLFENADMDAQAEKLYKTVSLAVKFLDDVDGLIPVLQEMGEKHALDYDCVRAHYDAVGECLIWTLKTGLGDAWTEEVADAWTWVYGVIAETMGDAGDAALAKRDGKKELTDADKIQIIRETWGKVEPIAEHATKIFYKLLRETDEDANKLFEDVDMEAQESKLADTLGLAVKNLDDLEGLIPVLEDMAIRHVEFGVTEPMYGTVGTCLLKTLETGLGDDWNDDVMKSWAWVYGIMADVCVKAAYKKDSKLAESLAVGSF